MSGSEGESEAPAVITTLESAGPPPAEAAAPTQEIPLSTQGPVEAPVLPATQAPVAEVTAPVEAVPPPPAGDEKEEESPVLEEAKQEYDEYKKTKVGAGKSILDAYNSGKWQPKSDEAVHARNATLADFQKKNRLNDSSYYDHSTGEYSCTLKGQKEETTGFATIEDSIAALRDISGTKEQILVDAEQDSQLKENAGHQAEIYERRLNDIENLQKALPSLGLEFQTTGVMEVFDKLAAGDLTPEEAQTQLLELGAKRAIEPVTEKGELPDKTRQALQGTIDALGLKGRGGKALTPEELYGLLAKPKQERDKESNIGMILLTLLYILMGVGSVSQAVANAAAEGQGGQR